MAHFENTGMWRLRDTLGLGWLSNGLIFHTVIGYGPVLDFTSSRNPVVGLAKLAHLNRQSLVEPTKWDKGR